MRNRHLQKRARTVRTLLKSLSANYRNGCPHITEKGVRELVKPAYAVGSHVIYFREHENTLLVVRILHGRMDVGRHM